MSKGAKIGRRGAGPYGEGRKEVRDGLGLLSGIIPSSTPAAFWKCPGTRFEIGSYQLKGCSICRGAQGV